MFYLVLVSGLILGYLSGSVSYARIFARIGKDVDITAVGNGNPGTSNVMREVGKFWGTLTLLGDSLKGSLIMILYSWLFLSSNPVIAIIPPFAGAGFIGILLIGIAAIYGHGFPIFYGFKGGGSIGVLFGCWFYLIYPQFIINIVIAYIIVKLLFPKKKYPMGRQTPFVFLFTTPFTMLAESLFIKEWHPLHAGSSVFEHIGWGNHFVLFDGNGWIIIAGILLYGIAVIPTNFRMLKTKEILAEK
jgi:acyl-phosphate glycerol 3-phosphate acyltransferase